MSSSGMQQRLLWLRHAGRLAGHMLTLLLEFCSTLAGTDLTPMSLGLSHSLSRYKLKFSPDKVRGALHLVNHFQSYDLLIQCSGRVYILRDFLCIRWTP